MTKEKEDFLAWMKEMYLTLLEHRYRKGDRKYKNDFFSIDLLHAALEENIDQGTYLLGEIYKRKYNK